MKAGEFYEVGDMYMLFVGILRNRVSHIFVALTSRAVVSGSREYNTGVYNRDTGSLHMSKSGRKYTLAPQACGKAFEVTEIYRSRIPDCYKQLDNEKVLHLSSGMVVRRIEYTANEYAGVYNIYKHTLNEFTQSTSFDQRYVTGSQLHASMSWVIACPPPVPHHVRSSMRNECGGVVPSCETHRDHPHSGFTQWCREESSPNSFGVLMHASSSSDDDDE